MFILYKCCGLLCCELFIEWKCNLIISIIIIIHWNSYNFFLGFYIGFEGWAQNATPQVLTMPAVNAARQQYAVTQQQRSEGAYQLPPPPPKSLLYEQTAAQMSFTNTQDLQYQMLQKVRVDIRLLLFACSRKPVSDEVVLPLHVTFIF